MQEAGSVRFCCLEIAVPCIGVPPLRILISEPGHSLGKELIRQILLFRNQKLMEVHLERIHGEAAWQGNLVSLEQSDRVPPLFS